LGTVSIRLDPLGKESTAERGTSLLDILHEFGVEFPCGGKGSCGKCKIKLVQGELTPDARHLDKLGELGLGPEWRLACMSRAENDLVLEVGQFEVLIQADETPFEFNASDGYGVAVDLGTTSLVAQLLELSTAKVLAVESALNPQRRFGSDLISRLEYALVQGSTLLTTLIRKEVGEMLSKLLRDRNLTLNKVVIVGNTVMQHLFSGLDIKTLSFFPFESSTLGVQVFKAAALEWTIQCEDIQFYPSIGSFVGSDILAGIHATGMWRKKDYSVLVDLGTNGEIVVGNSEGLWCASTAAGPAFEGARISMGMLATTGAISSVDQGPEGIFCQVIGNVPAAGICGSGLIDAVSVLLERGQLGTFGEIQSGQTELPLEGEVLLTQKDIQEFQLAKAALAAGLHILLRKLGIREDDVSAVYIAGAFGNYINLERMVHTGMMDFPMDRFHKLGNSALIGAKMFLFSDLVLAEKILALCHHMNLESEKDFQDIFVDRLSFNLPTS
jgi:uncharacterized 2Fe-2S/4Fe-4S cluster protein (DUF4445 family)